uniref:YceI family protein n=1 Tax=Geothrix sp. SG200 TaxID=2922865 RepID=UPI001FADED63
LAKVSGRFTKFEGTIQVDTADISKSSVAVTIDAASLTTDNEARDKHLKSPDFFDVAKYPTITFKSTSVKEVAKGKLEITGDFTLHGVTKRITFPITNAGTQPGMAPGSVVAGFIDGALSLNRNEYGIKTFPGVIGETVAVSLNAEAGKVAQIAQK